MSGALMDVVIPVKRTVQDDSESLRYALRSIETNVEHDRVWIVGEKPRWVVNCGYLPVPQRPAQKLANVRRNIMAACLESLVSEHFIYMNDDIFTLRKLSYAKLNVSRGGIDALVSACEARRELSTHIRRIGEAGKFLRSQWGVEEPLAYDSLHWPQVFNKILLVDALEESERSGHTVWSTIYGNLFRTSSGARVVPNAKAAPPQFETAEVVSCSDKRWVDGFGQEIRDRFPLPCKYEAQD